MLAGVENLRVKYDPINILYVPPERVEDRPPDPHRRCAVDQRLDWQHHNPEQSQCTACADRHLADAGRNPDPVG